MSSIPVIDIIFLILIALMVIHGLLKGFIGELFSWAPMILAICLAIFLYPAGAEFLKKRILQDARYVHEILAFAIVFIFFILVLKLLEHILKDIVTGAKLGSLDKLLGAAFGLIEGAALTMVILLLLAVQPFFDASKVIGDSFIAQLLLPLFPLLRVPLNRGKELMNIVYLIMPAESGV